jgi:hypothetical protein
LQGLRAKRTATDGEIAVEKPNSVQLSAREIRKQKIQAYEVKMLAAKVIEDNKRNDLLLKVLPQQDGTGTPALVDDATDTNSPGNSDNEDPNNHNVDINNDEAKTTTSPHTNAEDETNVTSTHNNNNDNVDDDDEETNCNNQSPPLSPMSILSLNTKPTLIHPPRSISRNDNESENAEHNQCHNSALGVLCGCI